MPSDAELLESLRTTYQAVIEGRVQEFGEGDERAKMLDPDKLLRQITELEAKVNGGTNNPIL